MTSLNLKTHIFETRKFVMAILHWKQGLLCDKYFFSVIREMSAESLHHTGSKFEPMRVCKGPYVNKTKSKSLPLNGLIIFKRFQAGLLSPTIQRLKNAERYEFM